MVVSLLLFVFFTSPSIATLLCRNITPPATVFYDKTINETCKNDILGKYELTPCVSSVELGVLNLGCLSSNHTKEMRKLCALAKKTAKLECDYDLKTIDGVGYPTEGTGSCCCYMELCNVNPPFWLIKRDREELLLPRWRRTLRQCCFLFSFTTFLVIIVGVEAYVETKLRMWWSVRTGKNKVTARWNPFRRASFKDTQEETGSDETTKPSLPSAVQAASVTANEPSEQLYTQRSNENLFTDNTMQDTPMHSQTTQATHRKNRSGLHSTQPTSLEKKKRAVPPPLPVHTPSPAQPTNAKQRKLAAVPSDVQVTQKFSSAIDDEPTPRSSSLDKTQPF